MLHLFLQQNIIMMQYLIIGYVLYKRRLITKQGNLKDILAIRYGHLHKLLRKEGLFLVELQKQACYNVIHSSFVKGKKQSRIFDDSELVENSVVKKYLITAAD